MAGKIRGLVNLLLVGMTLDTEADLVDGETHREALVHSEGRSRRQQMAYKSPPAVSRRSSWVFSI